MTVKFEGQDRRQATLDKVLPEYGFNSLEEAAINKNCLKSTICGVCKGKRKTAGGYHWAYVDIYTKE